MNYISGADKGGSVVAVFALIIASPILALGAGIFIFSAGALLLILITVFLFPRFTFAIKIYGIAILLSTALILPFLHFSRYFGSGDLLSVVTVYLAAALCAAGAVALVMLALFVLSLLGSRNRSKTNPSQNSAAFKKATPNWLGAILAIPAIILACLPIYYYIAGIALGFEIGRTVFCSIKQVERNVGSILGCSVTIPLQSSLEQ